MLLTEFPLPIMSTSLKDNRSISHFSKEAMVQQRMKDSEKQFLANHQAHEIVSQMAKAILGKLNTLISDMPESLLSYQDKIKMLNNQIKIGDAMMLMHDRERENIILIKEKALKIIIDEQSVLDFQQNKKDLIAIRQDMDLFKHELLNITHGQADLLQEKNLNLFKIVKDFEDILKTVEATFPSLNQKLETIVAKSGDIKLKEDEIEKGLEDLSKQTKLTALEQAKLEKRLDTLIIKFESAASKDILAMIKKDILNSPNLKEALKKICDKKNALSLAKYAIQTSREKISGFMGKIKSIHSHVWKKIKELPSKIVEKIERLKSAIRSAPGQIIPSLLKWVWNKIKNGGIEVKIAVGAIVAYSMRSLIFKKPLLSLGVGTILFLIYADV